MQENIETLITEARMGQDTREISQIEVIEVTIVPDQWVTFQASRETTTTFQEGRTEVTETMIVGETTTLAIAEETIIVVNCNCLLGQHLWGTPTRESRNHSL